MKHIIFALVLLSTVSVAYAQEYPELGIKVETIAENLSIPWSIDFASDGRIFFTERTGSVRVIVDGVLLAPILSLDVSGGEGGMLGIVLDPDFENNNYVYLYYTYDEFISVKNKIVRYVEKENNWFEDKVLLNAIPGAPYHDGGRIAFGPDGKLYITTGDAGKPELSQNIDSVAGKILRINSDGTIPDDNPFEGSRVYSFGHRNPQGIAWDESGSLVATEHGPSGFRGFAHDEINLILPGNNYGWPDIIGDEKKQGMINPILHSGDDTWAPSGATFYYGDSIPQWSDKYLFASLRGQHLHIVEFNDDYTVKNHEKLLQSQFGRIRDVVVAPDESIYILTSNTDGRGNPVHNDDRILRITSINSINSFDDCIKAGNPVMESFPRQCITQDGNHFVEQIENIPNWVRNIFVWYGDELISENELLNAIKFLIEKKILIIN